MSTEAGATLTANGWRQACRMAAAAMSGWSLATLLGWPNPALYAVYPLVLTGLVPMLGRQVALHYLCGGLLAMACSGLIRALLDASPLAMLAAFALYAAACFRALTTQRLFLPGATGLVGGSVLVHLASYPGVSWEGLYWAHARATALTLLLAVLAQAAFPDAERRGRPPLRVHSPAQQRHIVALGTACSSLSFIAFQSMELSDALGAQAATVLVLLSLSRDAIWRAGLRRLTGTLAGAGFALGSQLLLQDNAGCWPLAAIALLLGLLWFAAGHARENAGPGHGFAAVTSVALLFGQLTPGHDVLGNGLYRIVSVIAAVSAMLACVSLVHRLLDRLPFTRWTP